MLLALALPKVILINNHRLRVLYNISYIIAAGFVFFNCWYNKQWAKVNNMADRVAVSMWASEATNTKEFVDAQSKTLSSPLNLCNSPGLYDYQLDAAGEWTYFNHTCAKICMPYMSNSDCVLGTELVQERDHEILFVTEMKETTFGRNGTAWNAQRYWTPVEDAYKFNFLYNYNVPEHDVKDINNLYMAQGFQGGSSKDTLTVILGADGSPLESFKPHRDGISLTVKQLLKYAERPNWLDQEQPELGFNYKKGTKFQNGPMGRQTGIEINIRIKCYNSASVPYKLRQPDWNGPLCTAQVQPSLPNWVWRRATDMLRGYPRHVLYHGVFVRMQAEGALRTFDLQRLLSFLVESIVLLELPALFFRFIMIQCLGHLSNVYSSVLEQKFSLAQHIASAATHVMMASSSYRDLADQTRGISLPQMSQSVTRALKEFKELSSSELNAFVLFCFSVALDVRSNRYTNYSKKKSMTDKVVRNVKHIKGLGKNPLERLDEGGPKHRIDGVLFKQIGSAAFLTTTSIQEGVAIDHVVKLFDKDRQVGFLERIFLPRFIREHVLHANSMFDGDQSLMLSSQDGLMFRSEQLDHRMRSLHLEPVAKKGEDDVLEDMAQLMAFTNQETSSQAIMSGVSAQSDEQPPLQPLTAQRQAKKEHLVHQEGLQQRSSQEQTHRDQSQEPLQKQAMQEQLPQQPLPQQPQQQQQQQHQQQVQYCDQSMLLELMTRVEEHEKLLAENTARLRVLQNTIGPSSKASREDIPDSSYSEASAAYDRRSTQAHSGCLLPSTCQATCWDASEQPKRPDPAVHDTYRGPHQKPKTEKLLRPMLFDTNEGDVMDDQLH